MKKPGRNDPCTCGSGKKYKSCCMNVDAAKNISPLKKKFSAKVISAGGSFKQEKPADNQNENFKAAQDYAKLMDRSFGEGLRQENELPPLPSSSTEYLPEK